MPDFLMKIISFVLGIITSISMSMTSLTTLINKSNFEVASSFDQVVYEDQLVPQKDTDGNWTFYTDRDLKVLQFTDVHIGGGIMSLKKDKKALNAVAAMVTAEKPDLVVLTGDSVYPVPFQAGTFNNGISTDMVITLLEKLGVYYTVCFGNHDSELYSDYSRDQIADMPTPTLNTAFSKKVRKMLTASAIRLSRSKTQRESLQAHSLFLIHMTIPTAIFSASSGNMTTFMKIRLPGTRKTSLQSTRPTRQ